MEASGGSAAKAAVFAALLERCDVLSAKYVVKIITGELRIGLREGLLEAAIAVAFGRPQAAVGMAMMLTGDTGEAAVLASEDRLGEAHLRLLHPIKFMLATPAENAADVMMRLGPAVWVEDKYDGIRAQLHRRGSEVRLYSRDLHDISSQFPEVVAAAGPLDWDGILDGEILAYAHGHVLPFLTLQGRIGRKAPTARLQDDVPVAYVAFDLLAIGPRSQAVEPLLATPLSERRRRLEALNLPTVADGGRFALSHMVCAESADELESAFAHARARRNEGLMVKDPNSGYSPGRRGIGWLKMKRALATLDCVVVGVEEGHGKRHGVLSDYTFAVRDESVDRFVTIGKAYTGLTDAEIAEMTRWFEAHTIHRLGRFRQVHPVVVVEVAFDVIQRSDRHQSGYALRFPRIVRLRIDKSPTEVDTLANVERLHRELQYGAEYLVTAGVKGTEAEAAGPG
jgi:DNA ligase-1